MSNFDKAYDITMRHEGGYVNDPLDRGGETYKGISRVHHPNWHGWVLIDRIKASHSAARDINRVAAANDTLQKLVRLFYKERYWDVNRLDEFNVKLGKEAFDTGVNMGPPVAARMLQEALNLCNDNGRLYPNLVVDGIVGPVTIRSAKQANIERVYRTMNLLQGERYINIMRNNETQERFWGGWLERVIC